MSNNFNLSQAVNTPFSFRNKIINGNFDIWQRGISQTSSGYGSDDRWININIGSTKTHSHQTFALGQTDVPGARYFSRTVVSSVAGAGNAVNKTQRIEGLVQFSGKTLTLSFYAKADVSRTIAVDFLQYFGTGGSPSSPVEGIGATKFNLTATWQKFTLTVSVPSVSGKTLGTAGDDYLAFRFWFDAGSTYSTQSVSLGQQSGTFDIARVQLEEGAVATPFEHRPIGLELSLCQRYFQTIPAVSMQAAAVSGKSLIASHPLKVTMFKTPVRTFTAADGSGHSVAASTDRVVLNAFPDANGSVSVSFVTLDAEL